MKRKINTKFRKNNRTRFCIYCGKQKSIDEFKAKEHILPKAIDGNLTPQNPFITDRVCDSCNHICGFFIDDPFIRSWFINNSKADCSNVFFNQVKLIHLYYLGESLDVKYLDFTCDFWLSPKSDNIFHFHKPWHNLKDIPPVAGIPAHLKRDKSINQGFVFLFLRNSDQNWTSKILRSIKSQFNKVPVYLVNSQYSSDEKFDLVPKSLIALCEYLQKIRGKFKIDSSLIIRLDNNYGERFLAKLAIGLGSLHLNEGFVDSQDADLLRSFMWEKNTIEEGKFQFWDQDLTMKI